jgi:hypothetical protein
MAKAAHHIGAKLSSVYLDHRINCESNLAVMQDNVKIDLV